MDRVTLTVGQVAALRRIAEGDVVQERDVPYRLRDDQGYLPGTTVHSISQRHLYWLPDAESQRVELNGEGKKALATYVRECGSRDQHPEHDWATNNRRLGRTTRGVVTCPGRRP